jgi:hypothetical protein
MDHWNGRVTAGLISHEFDSLAGRLPQRVGHADFQRTFPFGQLGACERM